MCVTVSYIIFKYVTLAGYSRCNIVGVRTDSFRECFDPLYSNPYVNAALLITSRDYDGDRWLQRSAIVRLGNTDWIGAPKHRR